MERQDGFALMRAVQRTRPYTAVVVVTTNSALFPAMTRSGAVGFMCKPFNPQYCVTALHNAIRYSLLHARISQAKDHVEACQRQVHLLSLVESEWAESKNQWRRV